MWSSSPTSRIHAGQPVFSGFAASEVFAVDRHVRTPYMENYNLNLERQISNRAVLQVGYVGSAGRKLFRYRDINQPTSATIAAQTSICDGCVPRPFPSFFYINQIESAANSNYNSLQASLRLRG